MTLPSFLTKKRVLLATAILTAVVGGYFLVHFVMTDRSFQKSAGLTGLSLISHVSQLLPIENDTKKEIEVANQLADTILKSDDITRSYLILLQNNFELRPGGGFLGQYAIIKIKNGDVISTVVEDANLLDQRIKDAGIKITPPWQLTRYSQIKRWMMRDSNFSPDYPTNAEKAQYFCRIGGCGSNFDGVIAVNGDVFNHILDVTGAIQMEGITYTSADATLKLEERVEKAYLGEDVTAEQKRARKNILKHLAKEIISRITTLDNIPKLVEFTQNELRDKNVMLWFKDEHLQTLVESVHWDGSVTENWDKDYLMVVDANLGALKTDYYVKRSLDYTVDFTGEHPVATVLYTYNHTATHGDWRTSDYHTYARILAPKGSTYLERKLTGGVSTGEGFDKTIFGYKVDVLIGHNQTIMIKYQLPDTITPDDYQLLIQKQSGIGNIPVTVHLVDKDGKTYDQQVTLAKDLKLSFTKPE